MSGTIHKNTVEDFLGGSLRIGEPAVAGNLTVFPVFGPQPTLQYVSFAQGVDAGVKVGELDSGASVNDLLVQNQSSDIVLLFEGEEVLGAQQNRTFDVSALIAPGARVVVPVSCMEVGRWDGRRHDEGMRSAPQTANPRMRRAKSDQARENISRGHEAPPTNHASGATSARRSASLQTASPAVDSSIRASWSSSRSSQPRTATPTHSPPPAAAASSARRTGAGRFDQARWPGRSSARNSISRLSCQPSPPTSRS